MPRTTAVRTTRPAVPAKVTPVTAASEVDESEAGTPEHVDALVNIALVSDEDGWVNILFDGLPPDAPVSPMLLQSR